MQDIGNRVVMHNAKSAAGDDFLSSDIEEFNTSTGIKRTAKIDILLTTVGMSRLHSKRYMTGNQCAPSKEWASERIRIFFVIKNIR